MNALDQRMLRLAARAACRGAGSVEPNPMVGCVIGTHDARVLGIGHHRRFGGSHAEVEALASCTRQGHATNGATAWVTLEPCNHHGKTPPCTRALMAAGIARVVIARVDPNPVSTGGIAALRAAGISVELFEGCPEAIHVSNAFCMRITQQRPWVIAKWAQSIDGKIATSSGESKWLSGPRSRRRVHALRGRVDTILTGIGTVLADDPRLTCRDAFPRRTPRRVLIDPSLRVPDTSMLLRGLSEAPLTIAATAKAITQHASRVERWRAVGVELFTLPEREAGPSPLRPLLEHLARVHDASNVLVEAGPGLVGALLAQDLLDEAHVYIAPLLVGDDAALSPARIAPLASLKDARRFELATVRQIGADARLVYRRLPD